MQYDTSAEQNLDLNKALIKNPVSSFYIRVKGNSMKGAGIEDGDLLIVDKSPQPQNNDIAVCIIDGEFTLKRLYKKGENLYLMPENDEFKPIKVTEYNDFSVWGIVTYVIHKT